MYCSKLQVSAKAGLWTVDWTMDWTLDWNTDWNLVIIMQTGKECATTKHLYQLPNFHTSSVGSLAVALANFVTSKPSVATNCKPRHSIPAS